MTTLFSSLFDSDWDLSSLLSSMYIANRTLSALDTDDFGSFSSLDKLTPPRVRPLTPVDMCQGYTVPIVYKDETWEEIERKKKAASACGSSSTLSSELPWKERKSRIDNALSWLRTELETMRVQDKALLGQLQRCQETIESIKQQRALWEECSEDDLDEGDEDHWEDWEISEFERSFAEGSEYASSTLSSKDSRSSGSTTTSGVSSMASQRSDRSDRSEKSPSMYQFSSSQNSTSKVSRTNSYFRQDLEVTV
ncbi:uncharacterized protein [Haliotis asinina]|uniref:uncharacterized protein isoform X1 n=2 Tax=Haliotis asinina TaxID=109174 RepID=UPI003531E96D